MQVKIFGNILDILTMLIYNTHIESIRREVSSMNENLKLERFSTEFNQLTETGKDYILAIQQALLFAQNEGGTQPPKTEKTA